MRVLRGSGEDKDIDSPAGQAAGGFFEGAAIVGKLPVIEGDGADSGAEGFEGGGEFVRTASRR